MPPSPAPITYVLLGGAIGFAALGVATGFAILLAVAFVLEIYLAVERGNAA